MARRRSVHRRHSRRRVGGVRTAGNRQSHIAAAKAAAGTEHTALFEATCVRKPGPPPARTEPRPVPERSTWHHEPVKVFDNLYYVGEKEYSAWAVDDVRRHHRD